MWIDSQTKLESWDDAAVQGTRVVHSASPWSDVVVYGIQIAGGYVGIVWTETLGRGGYRTKGHLRTSLASEHHILLFNVHDHAYVDISGDRDTPIGGLTQSTKRLHQWRDRAYADHAWTLERFLDALMAYGVQNVAEMEELWR